MILTATTMTAMKRKAMALAWLLCLGMAATLAGCSDDDDNDTTVPDSVTASMAGRYDSFMLIGGKITTYVMQVSVSGTQATFTVPYAELLSAFVSADNMNEAVASVKGSDVTATFRPMYYNKGVASYLGDTQTAVFSCTVGGKKTSGTVTVKMPSLAFSADTRKLVLSYQITGISAGGKEVSGFKAMSVSMREAERKD